MRYYVLAFLLSLTQAVKFMNEELTDMNNCVIYTNSRFWALSSLRNDNNDYEVDGSDTLQTFRFNFCRNTVFSCNGGQSYANDYVKAADECIPLTENNDELNGIEYLQADDNGLSWEATGTQDCKTGQGKYGVRFNLVCNKEATTPTYKV